MGSRIRPGPDMLRPTWRLRDLRLVVVGGFFVLAWIGIGYRLFDVQVVEAASYDQYGIDQRLKQEEIPARRGTIYDSDWVELAVTVDLPSVMADPSQVTDPRGTAELLAPLVGGDANVIADRLDRPESKFAYVARHLDAATGAALQERLDAFHECRADRTQNDCEWELEGIYIQDEPYRVYPAGDLASQVLGFVQEDDQQGLEGLEATFDDLLAGTPGQRIVERDPDGLPISSGEYLITPEVPGVDIRTTINRPVQHIAQEAAAQAVADTNALSATIVVIRPHTGEILAMATAPGFDPNDRATIDPDTVRNRAVTDVYEPGSTLKVVTVSAALDQGVVTPQDSWLVPAEYQVDGKDEPYTDVGRTEDRVMTVAEILTNSSNVGTIQIQEKLGNELHHQYLEAYGLGHKTTDSLAGEVSGNLRPVEDWVSATAGASTAIGYRVDVTPLQMAALFGTIANDGIWVEPHIVDEMVYPDGSRDIFVPRERPVISASTAQQMRELLQAVVQQGTGHRAAIEGYGVGGKTGTTEKYLYEEGTYSPDDRIASFIGIAPIDNPELVIAVVLDSPQGEIEEDGNMVELQFGGVSAAPVFARVAEAALQALGVPPNGS
jgi:cell division protein FtsI (penicillin-binding protein 3)